MANDTPPSSSSSSFDDLPTEVLRSILSYMDVPSLAVLSNSHRGIDGNVSELASDDVTWYSLVRERFGIGRDNRRLRRRRRRYGRCGVSRIGCEEEKEEEEEEVGVVVVNKRGGGGRPASDSTHGGLLRRRPASYGGRDWKSAYRSLSSTMRIPETHLTGGAVFASTSSSTSSALGRRRCGSEGSGRGPADYLGVWCMVNHAENCRTRTVVDARATTGAGGCRPPLGRRQAASLPYRSDRRYIELKMCLQNTKSGYGRLVVPDVRSIRISSHDEEEEDRRRLDDYDDSSSRAEDRRREEDLRRRRHRGHDDDDNGYYHREEQSTFEILEDGPWAPRIALRRRAFFADDDDYYHDDGCDRDDSPTADLDDATAADDTTRTSVILRPFEVVVLSIHVSCPGCFLYETDALSSMSSIRVPVAAADGWPTGGGPASGSRCGGGDGGIGAVDDARGRRRDASIARFLPEDDLWEYYCLLPGGCMSLKDRSRLVPM